MQCTMSKETYDGDCYIAERVEYCIQIKFKKEEV